MKADPQLKPLSWRDPEGFVVREDGRVFRSIRGEAVGKVKDLLACQWFQREMESGHIAKSWWTDDGPSGLPGVQEFAWLEHRALTFPCYPHEVTAAQLHDAACLTLRLASEAAKHGWMLKDASAWNVLFEHGRPVFCDVLSFDELNSAGVWFAYAQFCRHFIIPLLIYKHTGIQPASFFLSHRDGVPPQVAYPLIRGLGVIDFVFLEAVAMPVWLHSQGKGVKKFGGVGDSKRPREMVQYLLERGYQRLARQLEKLAPANKARYSVWGAYEESRDHYSANDIQAKRSFTERNISWHNPRTVLDIGCNAGEYSLLAASHGASVVAGDFDQEALGKLYGKLRQKSANVNPVVLNIARPTPAIGWMNTEVASFLERACNQFDLIIAYGLIHHMIVTERLPLSMIVDLFVKLNPSQILIEWVGPRDSKFIEIAGANLHLYADLDANAFEVAFAKAYVLADKQVLSRGTRTLYLWGRP